MKCYIVRSTWEEEYQEWNEVEGVFTDKVKAEERVKYLEKGYENGDINPPYRGGSGIVNFRFVYLEEAPLIIT